MKRPARAAFVAFALISAFGVTGVASASERDGFVYVGAVYDDRYADSIFVMDALKPFGSPTAHVRPYADVQTNIDSQTLSVEIPNTLTDNYILGALGLQYLNGKGLRAYVQVGLTARVGALAAREPTGDVRSGLQFFKNWGGLSVGSPSRAGYATFFGQAIYGNRDRDAVLFDQIELGRALAETRNAVDLYVRGALSLDSHGFYYANDIEGIVGFRLRPHFGSGLSFTAEKVFGTYVRSIARPTGVGSTYRNFRLNAGYGFAF